MYEMSQRHPVWVTENHVKPCNSVPRAGLHADAGLFSKFPVVPAQSGSQPLSFACDGGGAAALGAVAAAAGLLELLLLVERGDGGHRLAGLAAFLVRRFRRGHCRDGRRHVMGVN